MASNVVHSKDAAAYPGWSGTHLEMWGGQWIADSVDETAKTGGRVSAKKASE